MEKLRELWTMYRTPIIIGLVVLVGLVVVIGQRAINKQSPVEQSPLAMDATSSSVGSVVTTGNHQPQRVCIDIKGAVKHPGIYYFKRGARVAEALKAAGGQLPNAEMKAVNLAKELTDQQVVYVPVVGEQVSSEEGQPIASSNANDGGKAPVNINTASKDQLCQITGIGDKKADLIIAYRQEHGQFKTVDELTQVSGFGEKTVAKIKDEVAV